MADTVGLMYEGELREARAEIARLTAYQNETALAWTKLTESQEQEIAKLTAALQRIDGINDNPAKYNPDIDAVLRGALEQNAQPKR